jgi:hypothetical protein
VVATHAHVGEGKGEWMVGIGQWALGGGHVTKKVGESQGLSSGPP